MITVAGSATNDSDTAPAPWRNQEDTNSSFLIEKLLSY